MSTDYRGDLVALSRRLGDPDRDLAILGEGNASVRVSEDGMLIKASGARLVGLTDHDIVHIHPGELTPFLDDHVLTQDKLTRRLKGGACGGPGRHASLESLMHVALAQAGVTWIAHTHPTAVLTLLSTELAQDFWDRPAFPDEAVVLGRPLWVPYASPGVALGRAVSERLNWYLDAEGVPPRVVMLQNHGIVALGDSAQEVETCTEMCIKAARVRAGAMSVRSYRGLTRDEGRALAKRDDEVARVRQLRSDPMS